MRLELANYETSDVRFGDTTWWRDGVLEIDRDELVSLIHKDPSGVSRGG